MATVSVEEHVVPGTIVTSTGEGTAITVTEAPETITDIQNYLQSFNKEIGEASGGNTNDGSSGNPNATFYTIDTSQVRGLLMNASELTFAHLSRFLLMVLHLRLPMLHQDQLVELKTQPLASKHWL